MPALGGIRYEVEGHQSSVTSPGTIFEDDSILQEIVGVDSNTGFWRLHFLACENGLPLVSMIALSALTKTT